METAGVEGPSALLTCWYRPWEYWPHPSHSSAYEGTGCSNNPFTSSRLVRPRRTAQLIREVIMAQTIPLLIGIDVSKEWLDLDGDEPLKTRRLDNTPEAIDAFLEDTCFRPPHEDADKST